LWSNRITVLYTVHWFIQCNKHWWRIFLLMWWEEILLQKRYFNTYCCISFENTGEQQMKTLKRAITGSSIFYWIKSEILESESETLKTYLLQYATLMF
jgi:hypothetical protein